LHVIYYVYVFRAVLDLMECVNWRFAVSFSRFLEISRNRLTALKACQAAHALKAYFLGFYYALPGG